MIAVNAVIQQAVARRGAAVTPRLRTSAEKILEFEAPVFRGDDGRCVPRWSWFAGAERELEMGVLVPGHRRILFLAPGL